MNGRLMKVKVFMCLFEVGIFTSRSPSAPLLKLSALSLLLPSPAQSETKHVSPLLRLVWAQAPQTTDGSECDTAILVTLDSLSCRNAFRLSVVN